MKKTIAFDGLRIVGFQGPDSVHLISSNINAGNGTRVLIPTAYRLDGKPIVLSFAFGSEFPTPVVDVREVIEATYRWGVELQMFPGDVAHHDALIKKMFDSRFLHLAVQTLWDVSDIKRHEVMAKWIYVLFLLDDLIDRKDGNLAKSQNRDILTTFLDNLILICYGNKKADALSMQPQVASILDVQERASLRFLCRAVESFNRALVEVSPNNLGNFYRSVAVYFRSATREMALAESPSRTLKAYFKVRDESGGVPTVVTLANFLRGLPAVPSAVQQTYEFRKGPIKGDRAICLENDAVGAKEWDGSEPNFVKLYTGTPVSKLPDRETLLTALRALVQKHDANMVKFYLRWDQLDTQLASSSSMLVSQLALEGCSPEAARQSVNDEFRAYLAIMAGNFFLSCGDRYQATPVEVR